MPDLLDFSQSPTPGDERRLRDSLADLPFFPLATDAYLADTAHLTDAEQGRYILVLIALWRAPKQRLPNDDDWLARKFHREPERVRSELRPLVSEFCQCDGNWITQKRLSKEYARATRMVAQRRAAANARWLKEKESSERIAASYGSRNAPTLIPTPILESSSSEISTVAARGAALRRNGSAPRAMAAVLNELAEKHRGKQ